MLGGGLCLAPAWLASTFVGAVAGSTLPEGIPLDFTIPLLFMVLLIPVLTTGPALVAAAVGGCMAVIGAGIGDGNLAVIIGAVSGLAAGVVADLALTSGDADPSLDGPDSDVELDGFRATTHWGWIDSLAAYEKINVVDERVVVDRNRITGGGITAGIDFALTLIAEVVAPPAAQAMQLIFEYRPEPPFDSGSPTSAPPEILAMVKQQIAQQSGELFQYIRSKSP
jgi:hypothetical protein